MLSHIKEGDRIGIVTFNSIAEVFLPIGPLPTDTNEFTSLKERITKLTSRGSTNFEIGRKFCLI